MATFRTIHTAYGLEAMATAEAISPNKAPPKHPSRISP